MNTGQRLDIALTSPAFDTILKVYDSSCSRMLATNDDGGGGLNARMRWTAPMRGNYVIAVSSYQRRGTGLYTLTVSADSTAPVLTDEEKQTLQNFSKWVGSASGDEMIATWRATSAAAVQLGCLSQERFTSDATRRNTARREALLTCTAALNQATAARKEILAEGKQK